MNVNLSVLTDEELEAEVTWAARMEPVDLLEEGRRWVAAVNAEWHRRNPIEPTMYQLIKVTRGGTILAAVDADALVDVAGDESFEGADAVAIVAELVQELEARS